MRRFAFEKNSPEKVEGEWDFHKKLFSKKHHPDVTEKWKILVIPKKIEGKGNTWALKIKDDVKWKIYFNLHFIKK